MVNLVLCNLLLLVHSAKPKQNEGIACKGFCSKKKKKDKNVSMCNLIFVLPNEDVTFSLKQLKIQMQRAAGHLKYMA